MANNRPIVANLDFTDLKSDIIEYFKSRPEFADYEFTGSSLNLLMDILAYNTHYNSLAANFLINEMFLDTAVLRDNVVSIAKMLNYTPRSATSAFSTVVVKVPRLTNENFYVIPAGTVFTAAAGNSSLNFFTKRDYTVQYEGSENTKQISIDVFEGQYVTQSFVNNSSTVNFQRFEILNDNIDTSTLTVSVNNEKWKMITPTEEGITDTNSTAQIYFLEEGRNSKYNLVFGNGVIGKSLSVGDEVVATFLTTNKEAGNGISNFGISIAGRPDITVVSASTSQGGSAAETIREIKDNAPHWYQSQYRAVTENDYKVILKQKFADIRSINVYGGEKVDKPGKVYIAIRPKSSDALTQSTKNTLVNDILSDTNILTIQPEIVDPFYIDIILKSVVVFDETKLVTNSETLKAKVLSLFNVFNTNYLGDFLETFSISELSAEIKDLDPSIVSSNTRSSIRVTIGTNNNKLDRYTWTYENKIYHPQAGYKPVLSTNLFKIPTDSDGNYGFDDDGNGNIRLYEYVDGQNVYKNNKAGTINYDSGSIEIDTTFATSDAEIRFTVVPDSFDVIALNNTILRIAPESSLVETVDKNEKELLKAINVSRSV